MVGIAEQFLAEDFAAYNLQDRTVRSRVTFYFSDKDTVTFDNDDMIISWSISEALTDTINTPFDACCANSCSLTVYNRYTGKLFDKDMVDARIFDPLQNEAIKLNLRFKIQVAALRKDNAWTPWKTVGIFYTTEITINDDRTTATLAGDDLLATIFNKNLPALPIYRNMSYKDFMTLFCKQYDLPVVWEHEQLEKLRFAYCSPSTKETIQGLVSGAMTVANITYDADDNEQLTITPFVAFQELEPFTLIDYSNLDAEDAAAQFYSVSYNKSLLSTNDKTRVVWYSPSVDTPSTAFSYSATDLDDFTKQKDGTYSYLLSRTQSSVTPLNNIEYTCVVSPYTEDEANFGVGILGLKNTQYTLTGHADENLATLPDATEYSAEVCARGLNLESQMLPADVLDKDAKDIQSYIEVAFPYCLSLPIARKRLQMLAAWTFCNLQQVSTVWRYNPYIPLASCVMLETQIYDLKSFTGIMWQQKISYNSGGLQSDAIIVNRNAFSGSLEIYDVAGYQSSSDAEMSRVYIVGKMSEVFGVWSVDKDYVDDYGAYTLIGKLPRGFTDAAITFDGTWSLNLTQNIYTLITEEMPWIFSVCGGALYAQHGPKDEYMLIDAPVKYCAAERGYYPQEYGDLDSDQGVIVAYITDSGIAKYRTYAVTKEGKRWLAAEEIGNYDANTVQGIQIHRLNDYRIGIVVTTTEGTYWHITDRVYSQMAFRPETFKVQSAEITPIMHAAVRMDGVAATPQPTFTWEINAAKTQVTLTSNARLKLYEGYDLKSAISGTTNMPSISSVVLNDYTIVVNFTKAATATFTITLNAGNIRFVAYVPDMLEVAGGWVVVTAASHEFEIYLDQRASENFNVQAAQVKSVSAEILPIYTIAQQAKEHFSVAAPVIGNIQAEIKDTREKVTATESENFNVQAAQITSISATIEGIGIIPM